MTDRLINILPIVRKHALARSYYFRLGVVATVLVTGLVVASGVLLLPTYVFLTNSAHTKEVRLEQIQTTLSSSGGVALSARLNAVSTDAELLIALSNKPVASKTINLVLLTPRPGILLSGFTYTPANGNGSDKLLISGTAATRDSLRKYQIVLQGLSFVRTADLPVSAYAKDANIPFLITITLAP